MEFYLDTEFIEDGRTIDLLSIALVTADGREFYAASAEADESRASDWVRGNVLPHLPPPEERLTRAEIRRDLFNFVRTASPDHRPEFWAYFAAYDWVVLCQLFGRMVDLPKPFPYYCNDLQQLRTSMGGVGLIPHTGTAHNALDDARWLRMAHADLKRRAAER